MGWYPSAVGARPDLLRPLPAPAVAAQHDGAEQGMERPLHTSSWSLKSRPPFIPHLLPRGSRAEKCPALNPTGGGVGSQC